MFPIIIDDMKVLLIIILSLIIACFIMYIIGYRKGIKDTRETVAKVSFFGKN